jgi:hypothetical protein
VQYTGRQETPGFHHLHLNSVDAEAAIGFYTRLFPTTTARVDKAFFARRRGFRRSATAPRDSYAAASRASAGAASPATSRRYSVVVDRVLGQRVDQHVEPAAVIISHSTTG